MTRTSTFALTAVAGLFVGTSALAGGGTYGPGTGGAIPDND